MGRARLAVVLAVVAGLAVVTTAGLAGTSYWGEAGTPTSGAAPAPARASSDPATTRTVTDPRTGARLQVPRAAWRVRGPATRIFYADDRGRPVAIVRGPAVLRPGYCAEHPRGSSRAFAGFTRHSFTDWLRGLTQGRGAWTTGVTREKVALADGSAGVLRWIGLMGGDGPCAAAGIELALLRVGDVHAVLVADTGEDDTLTHDEIVAILGTLELA